MATHAKDQKQGPPLPKFAYTIVNPLMVALLNSPLHGMLSNDLMVLSFRGPKSGKSYQIPVGYIEQGNRLFVASHSGWWRSLQNAPVTVRLRGRSVRGTATILKDQNTIKQVVRMLVEKRGEEMARRMGIVDPDQADTEAIPAMPTVYIEIALEEQTP